MKTLAMVTLLINILSLDHQPFTTSTRQQHEAAKPQDRLLGFFFSFRWTFENQRIKIQQLNLIHKKAKSRLEQHTEGRWVEGGEGKY